MQTKHANLTLALTAMLALTALAGCTANAGPTGGASVYVKDAPTDDIAHLYVSFTKVQIHLKDAKTPQNDTDGEDDANDVEYRDVEGGTTNGTGRVKVEVRESDDDDEGGRGKWITLFEGNATVDLRAMNGTAAAFLGDAEVPVGTYNGIRIKVSSATLEFTNGTQVPVKVPSSHLFVVGKFKVEQDKETALTLDFDLDHSLVKLGNGNYVLKPVLHLEWKHRDWPEMKERLERMRERDERDRDERKQRDHDDE